MRARNQVVYELSLHTFSLSLQSLKLLFIGLSYVVMHHTCIHTYIHLYTYRCTYMHACAYMHKSCSLAACFDPILTIVSMLQTRSCRCRRQGQLAPAPRWCRIRRCFLPDTRPSPVDGESPQHEHWFSLLVYSICCAY